MLGRDQLGKEVVSELFLCLSNVAVLTLKLIFWSLFALGKVRGKIIGHIQPITFINKNNQKKKLWKEVNKECER